MRWLQRLAAGVLVTGMALILAASFLPWARSGTRCRSSYALVGIADRLGLLHGPAATLVKAWFLVPIAVLVTIWLVCTGRTRLSALFATVVAVGALAITQIVSQSPLPTEIGVTLSRAGALFALSGGLAAVLFAHRPPRGEQIR